MNKAKLLGQVESFMIQFECYKVRNPFITVHAPGSELGEFPLPIISPLG